LCVYKTYFLHRPNDYIGFTPSCPPTFYNKIAPMYTRDISITQMIVGKQWMKSCDMYRWAVETRTGEGSKQK